MTTRSFAPPPSTSRIAVVDANASSRSTLRRHLDREGYRVVELEKGRHLLRQEGKRVDVVCLDRELEDEDIDGVDVMRRLHLQHPEIPVIMVTADPALEAAVEAMKAGAYDCLARPVEPERFVQAVRRACQLSALHRQVRTLSGQFPAVRLSQLIGDSAGMREVGRQIDRVRDSDVTVCVFGASGTGKELVAREVHDRGHRKSGPFVAINCAAIPSSLQESELFGHEKGAFTGATNLRQGRFEQADGGTLFLDELGEMSPATQASLLRTLQEKTIRRVGGAKDIKVDVRIVCATHRDLKAEVAAGRFREDLYFRLMVFPIELPSLAERKEDILSPLKIFLVLSTKREEHIHAPPDFLQLPEVSSQGSLHLVCPETARLTHDANCDSALAFSPAERASARSVAQAWASPSLQNPRPCTAPYVFPCVEGTYHP